jgi:hypothetical protein
MWFLAGFILQVVVIVAGIRQEKRAGMWSWSKFAFALGFGALECAILIVPISMMDMKSPYFIPVFSTCGVIAALNFIWMIIVARRWRLPDGRTSIQAYRDQQAEVKAELKRESERT